jgi:SAM-dependent methyltransferase
MKSLTSNRKELDDAGSFRKWFSPSIFLLQRTLIPILERYASGDMLDVGCGSMPYESVVEGRTSSYDGLDIDPRNERVRFVCSVADMAPVASESYDTVLCSEVLEHVPYPQAAVAEMSRVMRSGGTLVVTVPFLARLHEEPNDFQRFTEYGLRLLLSDADFEVVLLEPIGTVAGFIAHQVSSAIVLPTWGIPILRWPLFVLNAGLIVLPALVLDALLKPVRRKLPLGYVVVARKPIS